MVQTKLFGGVVIPMLTPFNEDESIDLDATQEIIEHFISAKTIPFILGTTGESASIPDLHKPEFVKKVVKAVAGRNKIYSGISSNALITSLQLANEYSDSGIDVFVAHLPSYYPLTEIQIIKYYELLADKLPRPLIIYNIPATTHVSIPLDVIDKLSHHQNIIGLKDSERDLQRLEEAIEKWKNRSDFSHFIGWAAQSANGLLRGSDGIVPSNGNMCPALFYALYQAAINGDRDLALQLQQETDTIASIYQGVKTIGQTIAAQKLIMSQMGLCKPVVLPPLSRFYPEEESEIIEKAIKMDLKWER